MDPLLDGGIGLQVVLIVLFKVVVAFVFLLISTMMMIWFERKLISDMQNRIGPNRAGKWGMLQSLADGIKAFFKEDLKPAEADLGVFKLAPYLSLVPAFLLFTIIPVGGVFENGNDGVVSMFGKDTFLQVADPPIGILFALAMSSLAVYGVMLAGWSSGSKYPLLGSVRASAQMVSYEAALGLSVAAIVLVTGGLRTNQIVAEQATWGWNLWAAGFVPFFVFVIAATAELNRPPFDLVEAEQELVGGFHTEYSSIRFAMFFLAEFMNTITMSAIIVTLFLGGPNGPLLIGPDWIWPLVWFFAKLFCLLFMFVWFRATLPRVRYDQLMDLGWKVLIPIALGWLLLLGAMRLARDDILTFVDNSNANLAIVIGISFVILLVAGTLLTSAIQAGRASRDESVEAYD
jgi:NADH-quinone oxidoreductase subunit H